MPTIEPAVVDTPESTLDRWVLLEIFGHRAHYGRLTKGDLLGAPMVRVEVSCTAGHLRVHEYAPTAVFGVTDISEALAKDRATTSCEDKSHPHNQPWRPELVAHDEEEEDEDDDPFDIDGPAA